MRPEIRTMIRDKGRVWQVLDLEKKIKKLGFTLVVKASFVRQLRLISLSRPINQRQLTKKSVNEALLYLLLGVGEVVTVHLLFRHFILI